MFQTYPFRLFFTPHNTTDKLSWMPQSYSNTARSTSEINLNHMKKIDARVILLKLHQLGFSLEDLCFTSLMFDMVTI